MQYEKVLKLIAQWCQPHLQVDGRYIQLKFDEIAEAIFKRLIANKTVNLKDTTTVMELKELKKDTALCRSILDAVNQYLEVEGYGGNSEDYYSSDNSYINRILESKLGIPISLSLMYSCILGRLGVVCEAINFPRHFLLRWLEHPDLATEAERYSYIDVFHGGKRLNCSQAKALLSAELVNARDVFLVASPVDAARRMLRNLISIGN